MARHRAEADRKAQRVLDELFADDAPVEQSARRFLDSLDSGPVPAAVSRLFTVGMTDGPLVDHGRQTIIETLQRHDVVTGGLRFVLSPHG